MILIINPDFIYFIYLKSDQIDFFKNQSFFLPYISRHFYPTPQSLLVTIGRVGSKAFLQLVAPILPQDIIKGFNTRAPRKGAFRFFVHILLQPKAAA